MPEGRELISMKMQLSGWFDRESSLSGWDPVLSNVWVDCTKAERKTLPSLRFKAGLVDCLEPTMGMNRGCSGAQRPLFPPMFGSLQELLDRKLRLTKIDYTGRSIILHFGDLLFQMQPLTHTNVQIYDESNWAAVYRTSVLGDTPEETMRTFKCAIAFKVGRHVISFNSLDLVYQVSWAWAHERDDPKKGLAHRDCSPLDKWADFMQLWASLLESQVNGKKRLTALLHNWLRLPQNTQYNPGVGAYSVSELLYMAGLPPDLQLGDLLRSPSRTCRYLLALYQYLYDALHHIWPNVVRPCIHNDTLAPNVQQRMRYNRVLHVWTKDTVSMSIRLHEAIIAHNNADLNSTEEFDVWEPTLVKDALLMAPEFGPWILGQERWDAVRSELGPSVQPWLENPLVLAFQKLVSKKLVLSETARPDPMGFDKLFVPSSQMAKKRLTVLHYQHLGSGRHTRTVLEAKRNGQFNLVEGLERMMRLFRITILGSADVEIGPLEYCGVAMNVPVSNSGRDCYVYPSRGAPTQDVPYSVARNAVIQSITKVREWELKTMKQDRKALSETDAALRERAFNAFDAVYPSEWVQPSAGMADAIGALAMASTSEAVPKRRKRSSQMAMLISEPSSASDSAGRGKRPKRELDPDTYKTNKHAADGLI
ncbi:hypothetical protein PENSPDRAFT_695119 [Peniophora sp. CONT]|nr:hypothetical protein PENSPDRAFT_695119 [Peniophora sp. CONT]